VLRTREVGAEAVATDADTTGEIPMNDDFAKELTGTSRYVGVGIAREILSTWSTDDLITTQMIEWDDGGFRVEAWHTVANPVRDGIFVREVTGFSTNRGEWYNEIRYYPDGHTDEYYSYKVPDSQTIDQVVAFQ
jgi:hypothetical protein